MSGFTQARLLLADLARFAGKNWETLWKVGFLVSAIAGFVILRTYTASAAIPFPRPDGSLAVLLVICAFWCLLILLGLSIILIICIPATLYDKQLQQLVPWYILDRPTPLQIRQYVQHFLLIDAPYIAVFLLLPVLFAINYKFSIFKDEYAVWFYIIGSLFIAALTLIISWMLYVWSKDHFITPIKKDSSVRKEFIGMSFGLFFPNFLNTLFGLGLVLGYELRLTFSSSEPSWVKALFLFATYILVSFWPCLASTLVLFRAFKSVVAAVLIVFVLPLLFSGSQIGAVCLRLAGMGGGIPISLVEKLPDPGPSGQVSKHVVGCLVLRTSTETIVQRRVEDGKELTKCHLNPRTPVFIDRQPATDRQPAPTTVDTINNNDVLNIISVGRAT